MIITRNWLKDWIDISFISTKDICKTLNSIGLEVDSVVHYEAPDNCVVGYIKSKKQHENAEKLNVCEVDVGNGKVLQIVCGAKNVEAGQFVPVALIGATLPSGTIIKEANLRGVESCGMICSSSELGFPKTNDGILVLGEREFDFTPGTLLKAIPVMNDDAIDIGLTPNRSDCLSIYGVARDLSAALNLKLKQKTKLIDDTSQVGIGRVLNLMVDGRIDSSVIYKVFYQKDTRSSLEIDIRLALAEIEAKNVIDKHIKYAIHSTGVILRAYRGDVFDQSRDEKINVIVKKNEQGFDIVTSENILSIIGVFQENDSKATDKDEIVIIEASYIPSQYLSAQNLKDIKKSDDSLYKSLRGSESDINFGINFLGSVFSKTSNIGILTGSQQYIKDIETRRINVNIEDIHEIIGKEILRNDIIEILNKLGFVAVLKAEQNIIGIEIPEFRHDVVNKFDICEEITRIIGIDNIPSKHLVFTEKNRLNDVILDFEKRKHYRQRSAAVGFFESVHYVFDNKERIKSYGFETIEESKELLNPITNELNTLRVTLILNLLEATSKNINYGKKSVMLFEVGKIFDKQRKESMKIAFVATGLSEHASVKNHGKPREFDFLIFVEKIKQIIGDFEIKKTESKTSLFSPFEYGEIILNSEIIGNIGRLNIENGFGLDKAYMCEISFEKLNYFRKSVHAYSKLPSVSRDLSLLIPENLNFADVQECIKSCEIENLNSFFPINIYCDESMKNKKSLTITLNFQPEEKTFSDEEISYKIEKILKQLNEKLGITIR